MRSIIHLISRKFSLPLMLLFLFCQFKISAQCQEVAFFFNGKFRIIKYDSAWNKTLLPTEYMGFNGLTKSKIDTYNTELPEGHGNRIKDSSAICGDIINFFSMGAKWAIIDGNGKPLTDFKYDDLGIYRPRYLNSNGGYDKYGYWENIFVFARINNSFGLISKEGKEITPVNYSLPYIDKRYGNACDTLLYSTKNIFRTPDTLDCGICRENSTSFNYPLAGKSIILTKNNKLGSIDSTGKTVIPFIYDKIKMYGGVVETSANGGPVFYSKTGNDISGFDETHPVFVTYKQEGYSTGHSLFQGIYMVKQKGKWGCVNGLKKEMLKCVFIDPYEPAPSDPGILNFESGTDTYSYQFYYNKSDYTIEVKNEAFKVLDVSGHDVTPKFIQKYEKPKK